MIRSKKALKVLIAKEALKNKALAQIVLFIKTILSSGTERRKVRVHIEIIMRKKIISQIHPVIIKMIPCLQAQKSTIQFIVFLNREK